MESIKNGFDFSYLISLITGIIAALICITLHELSHGYIAYRLGDNTAKIRGRLTLNPLKHIDPLGLILMVVFRFGWAKPVPVNMFNFKNPKKGMAITALAGPFCNLLITVVLLLLYGALYLPISSLSWGSKFLSLIMLTAYMSLGLCIFNLIPVPPLDGSKVLFSALSDAQYMKLMHYERYFSLLLLVLVATGVLGTPLSNAIQWAFNRLFWFAQVTCNAVYILFYS